MKRIVMSASLCILALTAMSVQAADWPQWKGPNRNGTSSDTGLLREWKDGSLPQLVWKNAAVGQTMNGPAILGNFVYIVGAKGSSESVFCIDQTTGKTIWVRPIGKMAGGKAKFPVQRCTPTIYKNKMYVFSSAGNLCCLDPTSGATYWYRSAITSMGGVLPPFGYCESPYVDGKWVIVCPGGPTCSMCAIDRHWGANVWCAKTGFPAGGSSLMKASFGGEHQYVSFSGAGLFGVKMRGSGEVRWRYEAPAHSSGYNVVAPIWFGQTMLASSPAGTGCVWLQKEGTTYKAEEVWFEKSLKITAGDMLKINDYVFACNDDNGLFCFNYKTGEIAWSDKSLFEDDEVEADSLDSKGKKKKSSTRRKQAANVSLDTEYLAFADAKKSDSGDAPNSLTIPAAPKGKKGKKVTPPDVPECIATMTYAEGLLYIRTSSGSLALVEANPKEFVLRGKIVLPQFKKGTMSVTPVIANGFLYLREGSTIFCFDLRDKSRQESDEQDGGASGDKSGKKPLPGMPTAPGVQKRQAPKVG